MVDDSKSACYRNKFRLANSKETFKLVDYLLCSDHENTLPPWYTWACRVVRGECQDQTELGCTRCRGFATVVVCRYKFFVFQFPTSVWRWYSENYSSKPLEVMRIGPTSNCRHSKWKRMLRFAPNNNRYRQSVVAQRYSSDWFQVGTNNTATETEKSRFQ